MLHTVAKATTRMYKDNQQTTTPRGIVPYFTGEGEGIHAKGMNLLYNRNDLQKTMIYHWQENAYNEILKIGRAETSTKNSLLLLD